MRTLTPLATLWPIALTVACGDSGPRIAPGSDPDPDDVHQSSLVDFRVVTVVDGLEHPWGMAFLPDGDILVTERPGRLRVVRDGVLLDEPVDGVPAVGTGGQGGLLDIALHPDFVNNRWVYMTYAKGDGERTTSVVRGRWQGDRLTGVEEVYEADAWGDGSTHFGSRLAFDAQGALYVTVGERGERDEAQNLANDNGTILRLLDDGSIPDDNPFVDDDGASPAIWAYGIRNAQGLAFHPVTGDLWEAEHGPQGGDEINVITRGANYGWPTITYGVEYGGGVISHLTEKEGMEQPVHHWDASPALSGLTIYDGPSFPAWRGHLFAGGLSGRQLVRLQFAGYALTDSEVLLDDLDNRIRDVRTGPDGHLYLLVDAFSAPMLRLEPVSP